MLLSRVLRKPELLFRQAVPTDKDQIIKFLDDHFAKEEPCSRALKLSPEISHTTFTTTAIRCLNYPFSTIAIQENGDLAACFLNSVWNRSDPVESADFDDTGVPENLRLFLEFLNDAHSDFWKLIPPTVHSVINGELGSVAPEFRFKGIATDLLFKGMTKSNVEKYNIGGFMGGCTAIASQTAMKKIGFKCLKEKPFSQIVDSNGNEVLKVDDGTTTIQLMYKSIEDFGELPEKFL